MKPLVPIIMGSKSDLDHGTAIANGLSRFGIESEIRVASAHKAAAFALEVLSAYEADPRPKVYVTVAGRSNALSGLVDGAVTAPVIACPPYSDKFGGSDIFSSLRMPSGIAPAVVLEPGGAALLAAKILGVADESTRELVRRAQSAATSTIINDDRALRAE
jgi:5-(carboxyamino)imidazole ribonucleotide mutase/phosphoribosylaminoimidazole-succinocarboxamide synthase